MNAIMPRSILAITSGTKEPANEKTLTTGRAVLADVSPRQVPHNHGCNRKRKGSISLANDLANDLAPMLRARDRNYKQSD